MDQRAFSCDIFISYCHKGRVWVHNLLMKTQQDTYGFELCIHLRYVLSKSSTIKAVCNIYCLSHFQFAQYFGYDTIFTDTNKNIIQLTESNTM